MGAEVEAKLETPGFYPAAGGVIKLKIKPFDASRRVEKYELNSLGDLKGGKVVGVVSALPRSIAEAEVGIVASKFRELKLKQEVREVESLGPGNYCYVQLDYERASVVISSIGSYNRSRKAVANDVVQQVNEFLKSGKACEKHLADQLLVPVAILLECRQCWLGVLKDWQVAVQKETDHFKTNQMVIGQFLSE
jgi:RNA 3'-terminal phosphate cyclase (ATP)